MVVGLVVLPRLAPAGEETSVHCQPAITRPAVAALLPSRRIVPVVSASSASIRATGARAARSAECASSMPAPQVSVVQLHCPPEDVVGQVGSAPSTAKGRAPDCMRAMILAGVRAGFSDSISAAVPAASGALKLVPTL